MSVIIPSGVGARTTDETLSEVLSPTHDLWIEEARQLLQPDAGPSGALLDRWSAVRWLDERFLERFEAERAVMAELAAFIPALELDMLEAGAQRVAGLHLLLGRIGCRRGGAAEFAHAAAEFLEALEMWCAWIELAATRVRPEALSPGGRRILSELTASLTMYREAFA
jgi:hypothetical protein